MRNDIERILITEDQIRTKVRELADLLQEEYADKNPLFVGVLKGTICGT